MLSDLASEEARLASVKDYGIDTTIADPGVHHIVNLASNIFSVPIAMVSLVEANRQFFAASVGLDVCETSRDHSFCAHAIQRSEVMVVLDTLLDSRFWSNPLVTGDLNIRFYAGAPLQSPSGHNIGTLCIIDHKPRESFSGRDRQNLADLADLVLDKLELRRLDVARKSSVTRFEKIAATSPDAIICTDDLGLVTFWNSAAETMLGYSEEDMLDQSIASTIPEFDTLQRLIGANESLLGRRATELAVGRKDGSSVLVELSLSSWLEEGQPKFGAVLRDITERRKNEERLLRLAHLDPLTELPNRTLLRAQAENALKNGNSACVMLIDLDGFKDVNDSLGHSVGDAVLIEVANRLKACISPFGMVARMGGDEFAALISNIPNHQYAADVADLMIQGISEIFAIDGQPIHVSASVGVAIFPSDGSNFRELLSSADLALYKAKDEGRHCKRFFTPQLREAAVLKRAYQSEFRRAIEQNEFELFYQPQVRFSDGALMGAEALLRWRHPDQGLISPANFLPALERSPFAAQVGDWVLQAACLQAADWRRCGLGEFRMGVNLFGAQFVAGDLASRVRAALAEARLPAACLELEITENIILRHDEAMLGPLRQLRDLGVQIAFDDYGTGYASLVMLKRYPLSRLKIDQSFTKGMCVSPADAAIVRAILYLGRSFGLEVIAEGVETEEQAARLRKKGCEEAQGYLFGRPMPASIFAKRFRDVGGTSEAAPLLLIGTSG